MPTHVRLDQIDLDCYDSYGIPVIELKVVISCDRCGRWRDYQDFKAYRMGRYHVSCYCCNEDYGVSTYLGVVDITEGTLLDLIDQASAGAPNPLSFIHRKTKFLRELKNAIN